MPTHARPDICRRIAQIRLELTGQRGKSSFCKMLGISPSTYEYYESSRVPPAEVLVKIADTAGVDLRWLLTGESHPAARVPADHPALQRAAKMLADHPDAAAPLAAFLDILAASLKFPPKSPPTEAPAVTPVPPAGKDTWIPVLGRSAAGVAAFWASPEDARGVTKLEQIVERHARKARHAAPAAAALADEPAQPVQIVTLNKPDADDVVEFIAAGILRARWPDAFALRIDGDSMSPDIRHGDLVILSPSAPAAEGKPAVAQLADQIGVTCKLFRREGETVHLVPVNEQYAPQRFPASRLAWALRVLARVRP